MFGIKLNVKSANNNIEIMNNSHFTILFSLFFTVVTTSLGVK